MAYTHDTKTSMSHTVSTLAASEPVAYRLVFLETRIIRLHSALIVSIYLHSNFYDGLRNNISFLQEWLFSRSTSSNVIEFGTNEKRVCDRLL